MLDAKELSFNIQHMVYIVYALRSTIKDYIYVWMTNDLDKRLKEHNSWKTKSNKHYAPFIVLFQEEHNMRIKAREREKYWKSWCGKEQLKTLQ